MQKGKGGWRIAFLAGVASAAAWAPAGGAPRIAVDGKVVKGSRATMVGGHAMVPVRGVIERIPGAQVEWRTRQRQIVVTRAGDQVRLNMNSGYAHVNGQAVPLDAPVVMREGRALLPVRFVSEVLGAQVTYDKRRGLISIRSPEPGTRVAGYRSLSTERADAAGSIAMGGEEVIRLRTPGKYPSVQERADAVTERLNHALAGMAALLDKGKGFPADSVRVGSSGSDPTLFIGKTWVLPVTAEDAQDAGLSQQQLADKWARQMRYSLTRIYGRR